MKNKVDEMAIMEREILETVGADRFNSLSKGVSTAFLLLLISDKKELNLKEFENIILNIDDETIKNFIEKNIQEKIQEKTQENIKNILSLHLKYDKELLKEYILKAKDKSPYAFETPEILVELAIKLLTLKDTDTIADLGMGHGNFIVSASEENPNAKYFGVEINRSVYEIAHIRAKILGGNITLKLDDMFNLNLENKYNKIFSNYPYLPNLSSEIQYTRYFDAILDKILNINKSISSDWIFNLLLTDLMDEKGKSIGIMGIGNAIKSLDREIRKYFIDNGLIECIIELPERILEYTSMKTMMIIFSKGNSTVKMIDASQFYKKGRRVNIMNKEDIEKIIKATDTDDQLYYSNKINYETIKENEYTLLPSVYLNYKPIDNGISFGEVIRSITRGLSISADKLDTMVSNTPTDFQYLMLSDIKDGLINENLHFIENIEEKDKKHCLENEDLIFSKIGSPVKIAVAENVGDKKILVNGNCFIVKLDKTKVDPYYIKAFFESDQGVSSIKKITAGSAIPNISSSNLKGIIIPNVSLREQKKIGEKYKAKMQEISDLKSKLAKAMEELKKIC